MAENRHTGPLRLKKRFNKFWGSWGNGEKNKKIIIKKWVFWIRLIPMWGTTVRVFLQLSGIKRTNYETCSTNYKHFIVNDPALFPRFKWCIVAGTSNDYYNTADIRDPLNLLVGLRNVYRVVSLFLYLIATVSWFSCSSLLILYSRRHLQWLL